MNWFLVALLPPFLWSISNHIDKYLINKYFQNAGAGALVIFSALIGTVLLPVIALFTPGVFDISKINALIIIVNGILIICSLMPYLYALSKEEASVVVPLWQLIPVFTYLLAYVLLGESLSSRQLVAFGLIFIGTFIISLDLTHPIPKLKHTVLLLMVLSCLLGAIGGVVFKYVALEETFWVSAFWQYIGFTIFALFLLIFIPSYRRSFFYVVKQNKGFVLGLNTLNEFISIIAALIMNYASLLAPVALVSVLNGLQPFFVFVVGLILTLYFPKLGKEKVTTKDVIQKILAISIVIIGAYLLEGTW